MKEDETTAHFWIEVSPESAFTEEGLTAAIEDCMSIHEWAMEEMEKLWREGNFNPQANLLSARMGGYLRSQGSPVRAQRYSQVHALNRAVARFRQEMVEDMEPGMTGVSFRFPNPSPTLAYEEIAIEGRSLWGKYVYQDGRVSTVFGSLFLEGDWEQTLAEQARLHGVTIEMLSYLWYSATVKKIGGGPWLLRFNVHDPRSKMGKKKIRIEKEREKWR